MEPNKGQALDSGRSSLTQQSSGSGSHRGSKPGEAKETPSESKVPGLFIAQKTEIQGQVKFGDNCIVHPGCSIIAEGGPIIFGEYNIIEEKVRIINRLRKDENGRPIKQEMHIGSYNVFEVQAQIDSTNIGDMNEFQHRCVIGEGSKIDTYCQINPCVTLPKGTQLPSYSVVYDEGKTRINQEPNEEAKKVSIKELCAFLSEQLLKFNKPRD